MLQKLSDSKADKLTYAFPLYIPAFKSINYVQINSMDLQNVS